MMTRSRRTDPARTSRTGAFVVMLCMVGVLTLSPLRSTAERLVIFIAGPFLSAQEASARGINTFFQTFHSTTALIEKNRELTARVAELEVRVLDRNILAEERDELRGLLGRTPGSEGVLAFVLASPGSSPYDTLILDVGSAEQVSEGDRVFMGENVVIGTVTQVYEHASRATLHSTPGTQVDALIPGVDIFITATGRGAGTFEIMVPRDVAVIAGDPILLAGTARILGVVYGIEQKESDPFKKVFFRTPFNPSTLRFVRLAPTTDHAFEEDSLTP